MSSLAATRVTIRPAGRSDSAGIRRLAALDSAPVPAGPLLLAEVDGRLLAGLSLVDGRAIADPFVPTVALVELLRVGGRRPAAPAARRSRPGLRARARAAVARR